jgi:hypothetical protein
MFRFNQTIIREPTVCASLKLQYWCQLKYFVIELFADGLQNPPECVTQKVITRYVHHKILPSKLSHKSQLSN